MTSPVIVALDFPAASAALELARQLAPAKCRLKVGKELFAVGGPVLVEELQQLGFDVFLDLKFHDIPNTVASAVSAVARLGVWMVNVHASGGSRMMEAAREAADAATRRPLLIAVTVLTSMAEEDLREVGCEVTVKEQVGRLAALAAHSGLDGVVCSAMEAGDLRAAHGEAFCLVTPGIRLAGDAAGDQRRVVTPADARARGSDYLVVGRSITGASDPLAALDRVLAEAGGR